MNYTLLLFLPLIVVSGCNTTSSTRSVSNPPKSAASGSHSNTFEKRYLEYKKTMEPLVGKVDRAGFKQQVGNPGKVVPTASGETWYYYEKDDVITLRFNDQGILSKWSVQPKGVFNE